MIIRLIIEVKVFGLICRDFAGLEPTLVKSLAYCSLILEMGIYSISLPAALLAAREALGYPGFRAWP